MTYLSSRNFVTSVLLTIGVHAISLSAGAFPIFNYDDKTVQLASEWKAHSDKPFRLGDWEYVKLVRRSGSEIGAPNQHPFKLTPEQVAQALQKLKVGGDKGNTQLFTEQELKQLGPVVAAALEVATPDQDIVFLSRGRDADAGILGLELANAGRIFMADGKINLILGTERSEVLNALRPGIPPQVPPFTGLRQHQASGVKLAASQDVQLLRPDWGSIAPLNIAPLSTALPVPTNTAPPTIAASATSISSSTVNPTAAISPATTAATTATSTFAAPNAPAGSPSSNIEARLILLNRLHQQKLITDTEFQQKRAEILKEL